jgi:HEAT repeat protein
MSGVEQALNDADVWVRLNAAQALGKIGSTQSIEMLRQAMSDRNPNIRCKAAFALGEIIDSTYLVGCQLRKSC